MLAAEFSQRLSDEAAQLNERGAIEPNSDRIDRAADTAARMRTEFGRFGITRLAEVTGLDLIGIPVWMAVRPNARTLSVSQGKGLTDAAAQASAIMEAVELAVAERLDMDFRLCAAADLARAGEHALPLLNLLSRGETKIGETTLLAWAEGIDLLRCCPVWVPADTLSLDGSKGVTGQKSQYWRSSDGLASGNLLLEAIVHGLCERIERDASTLWLLRCDRDIFERCVSPADLQDKAVLRLAAQIADAELELRLFDITSDVDVPVFFATISPRLDGREQHWKYFDLSSGSGCHPTAARAAIRAITEAAQSRVTSIAGARDDFDPDLYRQRLGVDLLAYPAASPGRARVWPKEPMPPARLLEHMLQRLRSAGIRSVVAVPLMLGDGFAVAKVLVPDLEHLDGDRRQRFGSRALRAMVGAL